MLAQRQKDLQAVINYMSQTTTLNYVLRPSEQGRFYCLTLKTNYDVTKIKQWETWLNQRGYVYVITGGNIRVNGSIKVEG